MKSEELWSGSLEGPTIIILSGYCDLRIALKEVQEVLYWFELIHASEMLEEKLYSSPIQDADEIRRMLSRSVITAKRSEEDK